MWRTIAWHKRHRRSLVWSLAVVLLVAISIFLHSSPATSADTSAGYLGINNGTGYNTDPAYVDRSIEHTKDLGLGAARVGMDNVGGNTVGAEFRWEERDAAIDKYIAAGIAVHSPISARAHVERDPDYERWKSNFRYFVRNVMTHYKGKIFYYIVDNEPDLDYGNGTMSAQECVDMTKIAYEAAKSIDPNIKIESPPPSGPDSPLLGDMLDLGLADCTDYVGMHAYGGQIHEDRFSKPWKDLAARGVKKPIAISESGSIASWYQGSDADKQNSRSRWFAEFGQRLKRFGYDSALLFDLDSHDEWAIAPNFQPTPAYDKIKMLELNPFWSSAGFESDNDMEKDWVPFDPNDIGSSSFVTFIRGDAGGARSGSGYVKLESSKADRDVPINVRRIAGQLPQGRTIKVGAWAYASGGTQATLKALGYDNLDGDAELSVSSTRRNEWEYLELKVPISKYWTVVELSTLGTSNSSDFVKWDDVLLVN